MKKKVTGKDLRKEVPRSPRIRVGGYAILGRTIDNAGHWWRGTSANTISIAAR
jgi:hypothetical protein